MRKVLERRLLELDALCVWVTFIHELATYSNRAISMLTTADPGDHAVRTCKVVRQQASGRSLCPRHRGSSCSTTPLWQAMNGKARRSLAAQTTRMLS